jgi:hypothetical protein
VNFVDCKSLKLGFENLGILGLNFIFFSNFFITYCEDLCLLIPWRQGDKVF